NRSSGRASRATRCAPRRPCARRTPSPSLPSTESSNTPRPWRLRPPRRCRASSSRRSPSPGTVSAPHPRFALWSPLLSPSPQRRSVRNAIEYRPGQSIVGVQAEQIRNAQTVRGDQRKDFAGQRPESRPRQPSGDCAIRIERPEAYDVSLVASIDRTIIADHDELLRPGRAPELGKQAPRLIGAGRDELQLARGRLPAHPLHEMGTETAAVVVKNMKPHGVTHSQRRFTRSGRTAGRGETAL